MQYITLVVEFFVEYQAFSYAILAGIISVFVGIRKRINPFMFIYHMIGNIILSVFVMFNFALPLVAYIGSRLEKGLDDNLSVMIAGVMVLPAKPIVIIIIEVTPVAFQKIFTLAIDLVVEKFGRIFGKGDNDANQGTKGKD